MGLFDFFNSSPIPKKYVVLDIETTGLSQKNDRIIEIAANEYVKGELSRRFHTYVNPGMHIPGFISHLTGIRDSDVEDAPSILAIKEDLIRFISNSPIVGHNISTFDLPFLSIQIRTGFDNKQYDTLKIAQKVFPGLPCYKLSYLDQVFHLGGLEQHRASNDILTTNALFLACCEPHRYKHYLKDIQVPEKKPADSYHLTYQYDDVKFYPPEELVSKINKKVLCPGAEILLKQERNNKYDDHAVALYLSGHKIGYLLRGTIQDMTNDYIKNGWPIKASLSSLRFVGGEYKGYINLSYYRKTTNPKRLGYHDIDIHSILPSNPNAQIKTPLTDKNVVFSGLFNLPIEQMMQLAVDAGAILKSRVTKNVHYLVAGKQDERFLGENGMSSKESTATKLNKEGADIKIINEDAFFDLIDNISEKV